MLQIYEVIYQYRGWDPGSEDSTIAVSRWLPCAKKCCQGLDGRKSNDGIKAFAEVATQNPKFSDASDPEDRRAWKAIFDPLGK
jgi:hypothetical protein